MNPYKTVCFGGDTLARERYSPNYYTNLSSTQNELPLPGTDWTPTFPSIRSIAFLTIVNPTPENAKALAFMVEFLFHYPPGDPYQEGDPEKMDRVAVVAVGVVRGVAIRRWLPARLGPVRGLR